MSTNINKLTGAIEGPSDADTSIKAADSEVSGKSGKNITILAALDKSA